MLKWIHLPWGWFNRSLDFLIPLVDLFLRVYLFRVFFFSALTKVQSWQTTLSLFKYEYSVPWLDSVWAAWLGTTIELIIPILLLLGVFGRVPAVILFLFNAMAAYAYPFLWTEAGFNGLKDHFHWGLLLLVLMTHGSGKISVDHLFKWKKRGFSIS